MAVVPLVAASKEQKCPVSVRREAERTRQLASDSLPTSRTSLPAWAALAWAAADCTGQSGVAGGSQEVGNKGLHWSEMFLRVGNKNLQQAVEFLGVVSTGPEMAALRRYQAGETPLTDGRRAHLLLGVGLGEAGYMDRLTGYEKSYLQVLVSKQAFHKGPQTIALVPVALTRKGPGRTEAAALAS